MKNELQRVFLAAAKLIDSGREQFCCCALDEIGPVAFGDSPEEVFHRLFKPPGALSFGAYFGYVRPGGNPDLNHADSRERRVIALLLAAEIARCPEDLP